MPNALKPPLLLPLRVLLLLPRQQQLLQTLPDRTQLLRNRHAVGPQRLLPRALPPYPTHAICPQPPHPTHQQHGCRSCCCCRHCCRRRRRCRCCCWCTASGLAAYEDGRVRAAAVDCAIGQAFDCRLLLRALLHLLPLPLPLVLLLPPHPLLLLVALPALLIQLLVQLLKGGQQQQQQQISQSSTSTQGQLDTPHRCSGMM